MGRVTVGHLAASVASFRPLFLTLGKQLEEMSDTSVSDKQVLSADARIQRLGLDGTKKPSLKLLFSKKSSQLLQNNALPTASLAMALGHLPKTNPTRKQVTDLGMVLFHLLRSHYQTFTEANGLICGCFILNLYNKAPELVHHIATTGEKLIKGGSRSDAKDETGEAKELQTPTPETEANIKKESSLHKNQPTISLPEWAHQTRRIASKLGIPVAQLIVEQACKKSSFFGSEKKRKSSLFPVDCKKVKKIPGK